jgi:hypothetical protein
MFGGQPRQTERFGEIQIAARVGAAAERCMELASYSQFSAASAFDI